MDFHQDTFAVSFHFILLCCLFCLHNLTISPPDKTFCWENLIGPRGGHSEGTFQICVSFFANINRKRQKVETWQTSSTYDDRRCLYSFLYTLCVCGKLNRGWFIWLHNQERGHWEPSSFPHSVNSSGNIPWIQSTTEIYSTNAV